LLERFGGPLGVLVRVAQIAGIQHFQALGFHRRDEPEGVAPDTHVRYCLFDSRLLTERKHFIDTIKLIAYRAETSMALLLRDKLNREDDTRALLRQIYETEIDLVPDLQTNTLTVRLHHLTQPHTTKPSATYATNSTPPKRSSLAPI
jgi:hypothetical protein